MRVLMQPGCGDPSALVAEIMRQADRLAPLTLMGGLRLDDYPFAATGYAQFGYRYTLDYMPYMLLLIFIAVGRRVQWYEALLIGAGVLVNLWGVLWIFQFSNVPPHGLFGWTWISY